jgi:hypothetical protein
MADVSQPSPLTPARQRALALASSGDLTGARTVLERAVELGKANLSEDDPDVLLTAYQLGMVLQQSDDPSAARRVLEEAYAAGLWRLGDSDPLMLEISHGIGVAAEELGNRHEARKAFGRVAELGPAVLGGDHWAVARARGYLGQGSVRPEAVPASVEPTGEHSAPVRPRVQPPSPANQQVWTGPAGGPGQRAGDARPGPQAGRAGPGQRAAEAAPAGDGYGPIEEPTIAQPIITPRGGPVGLQAPADPGPHGFGGQPNLPRQRPASADHGYASSADPATRHGDPSMPPHPPGRAGDYRLGPPSAPGYAQPGRAGDYRPGPPSAPGYPQPAAAHPGPSSAEGGNGAASYRKGLGLFAAIAAVLASVIAVVALVFVLANRSGDPGSDSDVPTLAGPPPSDVRLRDSGAGIKISWQDPSDGSVSFMVAMGRTGEELKPIATLGPGQTSYELGGLNASLNYCFTVIAVYRSNQFATSPQACTSRAPATPR